MTAYIDEPLKRYVDDLFAKMPAPGGGSAAALAGALGVALIAMAVHYTLGKEKFKEHEEELILAMEQLKDYKGVLTSLIDADVAAYKKVSETFKSPDGTIKEKLLKDAATVPIEICSYCCKALQLCQVVMRNSNYNLLSDIGASAELLAAAYKSALYNIEVNIKNIKDEEFVSHIRAALSSQNQEVEKMKIYILDFVHKSLS